MSLLEQLEELDKYNYFDTIGANLFPIEDIEENEFAHELTGKNEIKRIGWRRDGSGLYLFTGCYEKISNWVLNNQVPILFISSDREKECVANNLVELLEKISIDGDYFDGNDYNSILECMDNDKDKKDLISANAMTRQGILKILNDHDDKN